MAGNSKIPHCYPTKNLLNTSEKLTDIERSFTSKEPEIQYPAIVLSLPVKPKMSHELGTSTIIHKYRVSHITEYLNRLYKRNPKREAKRKYAPQIA